MTTVPSSSQPKVTTPPAVPTFPRTWPCPHRHQQSSVKLSSCQPECTTGLLLHPAGSPGPSQLAPLSVPSLIFIPSHLKQLTRLPPRSVRGSVPGPMGGCFTQACLTIIPYITSITDRPPPSPGMPGSRVLSSPPCCPILLLPSCLRWPAAGGPKARATHTGT